MNATKHSVVVVLVVVGCGCGWLWLWLLWLLWLLLVVVGCCWLFVVTTVAAGCLFVVTGLLLLLLKRCWLRFQKKILNFFWEINISWKTCLSFFLVMVVATVSGSVFALSFLFFFFIQV